MMDTKEAIKELEDLTVNYGDRNEEQIARLDEAIDMAMDALRNLPNRLRQAMDTISRQSAIDAFLTELTKRERKNLLHTWSTVEVKYFITKMLEQMPSAQPETCDTCKHGYFGDTQCDNCCVRYPSHYERKTDERSDKQRSGD